jgi:hypothetical protein
VLQAQHVIQPLERWVLESSGRAAESGESGGGSGKAGSDATSKSSHMYRTRAARSGHRPGAFDVFFHDYSLATTGDNQRAREVGVSLGSHAEEEARYFLRPSSGDNSGGLDDTTTDSSGNGTDGGHGDTGGGGRRLARYSVSDQAAVDALLAASPAFAQVTFQGASATPCHSPQDHALPHSPCVLCLNAHPSLGVYLMSKKQLVPDFHAETHRNVLRQLFSLREVTRLWEAEARQEVTTMMAHLGLVGLIDHQHAPPPQERSERSDDDDDDATHRRRGSNNRWARPLLPRHDGAQATAFDAYYTAVLYLRPDLRFYDTLDVGPLLAVGPRDFLTLPV